MANVLFVLTSYDRLLNGDPTGLWLEEFAVPYTALTEAGHAVNVVSVSGGVVPVDPNSAPSADQKAAWADAIARLNDTPALDSVNARDYDAVYLPGGHGTVFDMPYNKGLHDLLFAFDDASKPLACVCHAPALFAGMRRADGTPFIAGRQVAGFANAEEEAVGGTAKVPFLLETRLRELGATYSGADAWAVHTVRDGNLITGQNPQSSQAVADKLLTALNETR